MMEDYSAPIWVPDNAADRCANCKEAFNTAWRRKHHCRLCGDVVCWACSQRQFVIPAIPLEPALDFPPEGSDAGAAQGEGEPTVARCCESCWEGVILPRAAATNGAGGTVQRLREESAREGRKVEGGSLTRVGGAVVAEFVQPLGGMKGTVRTRLRSFRR